MKLNAVPVGWDFQRLLAEKRLPVGDDFLNDDRRDQIVVYHASGIHYYHALLGGEPQPAVACPATGRLRCGRRGLAGLHAVFDSKACGLDHRSEEHTSELQSPMYLV